MKEVKWVRTGVPFALAGAGVLLYALILGMGSALGYILGAIIGVACFLAARRAFPDVRMEVDAAPRSGDAQVDALIAEARETLEAIEAANGQIEDAGLSARIDAIAATARKILLRLEEQPGNASQLRTFLRYYLPTTQKLLASRAKLEREGLAQADIAGRIDDAAATIHSAFERQLSALDEFRFINLESEMDALRSMMASEGLTEEATPEEAIAPDAAEQSDPFAGLFTQGGQ